MKKERKFKVVVMNPPTEIKIKTNADEEIEKAKELVSLLERANELIQSLNNLRITNLE